MNEELSPQERALVEKAVEDLKDPSYETSQMILNSLNRFGIEERLSLLEAMDLSSLESLLTIGLKCEDYKLCKIIKDLIAKKKLM